MSSMLKKTGDVKFKPKFARRPGGVGPSRSATSANTTRAPTAEPSATSQASTPAPTAATPASDNVPPTREDTTPVSEEPTQTPVAQVLTETQKETPSDSTTDQRAGRETISTRPTPQPARNVPPTPASTATSASTAIGTADQSTQPSSSTSKNSNNLTQEPLPTPAQTITPTATSTVTSTQPIVEQQNSPVSSSAPVTDTSSSTLNSSQQPLDKGKNAAVPRYSSARATPALQPPKPLGPPTISTRPMPSQGPPSPGIATALAGTAPPDQARISPSLFPVAESITVARPVEATRTDETTEAGPSSTAPKKKRQYRKRKAPAEGEGAENGEGAAAPKPKKPRKKKVPEGGQQVDEATTGSGTGATLHRRRREPTPEDAENQVIDRTTTTVGELTKDLGIGKKFKYHDIILERQRQARRDAKMRRLEKQKRALGLLPAEGEGSRAGTPADGADGDNATVTPVNTGAGVGYEIIDGRIVVNASSLVINQNEASTAHLETVEEDEFTHLTTSASYLRPSRAMGANYWNDEETERFYHYLQMFGTDFETISHVFPGKNRRMIKMKFSREEKLRPNRVNAAIMARGKKKVPIDLEDYKAQRRGDKWEDLDNIKKQHDLLKAELDEQLEQRRQERRDLGLLDDLPPPKKNTDEEGEDKEGEQIDNGDSNGDEVADGEEQPMDQVEAPTVLV